MSESNLVVKVLRDGKEISTTQVVRHEIGDKLFPKVSFKYHYKDENGKEKKGEVQPGTFRSQGPDACARLASEILKAVVTEARKPRKSTEA